MEQDEHNKLDDYLEGRMTPEERAAFNKKLDTDPKLKRDLQLEQDLSMLGDTNLGDFFDKIQQAEKQYLPKQRKLWPYFLSIASAAAILLLVWINPFTSGPKFENYFEVYPIVLAQRGENDQLTMIQAYQNRDWDQALPLIRNWQNKEPNNELVNLYLGIAALGANNLTVAIEQLENIANNATQVQEQARWYLALAHWQNGNRSAAKELLESISQEESYRHELAKDLLEQL